MTSEAASTTATSTSQTARNEPLTTSSGNHHRADPLDLPEDDPPAYTPGPDVHHGEATVEYGPSRLFQPPPHRPSQGPSQSQQRPPQHPGWSAIQNNILPRPSSLLQQITGNLVDRLNNLSTGGSTYNYNRYQGYPGNFGPPPGRFPSPPGPPPGHLPQQNTNSAQHPPPSHPLPSSDFARDFYHAGPNLQSSQGDATPSTTSSPAASGPPSGQASAPSNDGRPTQLPTPGHPLLNDGKLLVYPAGFVCKKCNNIGYKKANPKHPCRKCWSKHAKPFTGALGYVDFSPNATTGSGTTFQKPLPIQTPAQHVGPGPSNRYPGVAAHYHPPPVTSYPSLGHHRPPPPPQHPSVVVAGPGYQYPPGTVVYQPGDPRIGGQMCWKCDGDGLVDMLFWEDRCDVCRGTGRIFR